MLHWVSCVNSASNETDKFFCFRSIFFCHRRIRLWRKRQSYFVSRRLGNGSTRPLASLTILSERSESKDSPRSLAGLKHPRRPNTYSAFGYPRHKSMLWLESTFRSKIVSFIYVFSQSLTSRWLGCFRTARKKILRAWFACDQGIGKSKSFFPSAALPHRGGTSVAVRKQSRQDLLLCEICTKSIRLPL